MLELVKEKAYIRIALQARNTYGRVKIIDNLYADNLSNLEKSHKNKFQLPIANLPPLLYIIGSSQKLRSRTRKIISLKNISLFAEMVLWREVFPSDKSKTPLGFEKRLLLVIANTLYKNQED